MYAEVVVTRPTHRRPPPGSEPLRDDASHRQTFTYRLPERLQDDAAVGQLVLVPLQASLSLAVIVRVVDAPPSHLAPEALRDVEAILDPLPVVTPAHIELAFWIADEYLSPLSQALRLMLPPGLDERTTILVTGKAVPEAEKLTAEELRVTHWLQSRGGKAPLRTLLAQLDIEDPEAIVHALAERGLLETQFALVPPKPAPARVQYVRLLADEGTIRAALPRLGRPSKQADLLLTLARRADAPITVDELCERARCTRAPLEALAARGWVHITEERTLILATPGMMPDASQVRRAPKQAEVLKVLRERGEPLEVSQLLAQTGASEAVIGALERKEHVQRITEPSMVLLTLPPDQVLNRVLDLRGGHVERAVLEALRGATQPVWVGGLYAQTGADLSTLRRLAERGLISLHSESKASTPLPKIPGSPGPTGGQEAILRAVRDGLDWSSRGEQPFVGLLNPKVGDDLGTLYADAIDCVLSTGRRAIMLVPEIAPTAELVRRFEARFPGRVAMLHSELSLGRRYDAWDRVRRGQADVLIGARLALFAPMSRLGLIVVDDAHDESYKQDEPIPGPAYHACDVAVALGRLTGAAVLFGSPTPGVVLYQRARQGAYRLLELPTQEVAPSAAGVQRSEGRCLPAVRIVDLRQELRAGNRSIFSRALRQALTSTLQAGAQAILFVDRRGTATFVLCRDCGHVSRCPRCDIPLAYHRPALQVGRASEGAERDRTHDLLLCHRCGFRQPAPIACPVCSGKRIRHFGLGAERVEAEVRALYPRARVVRWDRDVATGRGRERFLEAFSEHQADVLVGTQMLAKVVDLPLVALVGVVSADTVLNLPDYRASERAFQLLMQLEGWAGRSDRSSQVFVQTYHPDHYAIRAAAARDLAGFYEQELAYRQRLGYPPFSRLLALRFSDEDAHRCQVEAERMGRWLAAEARRLRLALDLIGPAPCLVARAEGKWRWQIVIRAPDPLPILRGVALPRGWRVDVDPTSLL